MHAGRAAERLQVAQRLLQHRRDVGTCTFPSCIGFCAAHVRQVFAKEVHHCSELQDAA